MLTAEQRQFITPYQAPPPVPAKALSSLHATTAPTTRGEALASLGNRARKALRDDVVDILRAAHKHGTPDLTVGEIADAYRQLTGKNKPPSSFSQTIKDLQPEVITPTSERVYAGSGKKQMAYKLVAQQARLVG